MSWVSPIKDKETLQKFENGLKAAGEKYYVLFEIGLGTGLKMPDILGLRNEDVWEKEVLELNIGKKTIRRIFKIPENLQREILVYTEGKDPKAWLFPGRNGSEGASFQGTRLPGDEAGGRGAGAAACGKQHDAKDLRLELL